MEIWGGDTNYTILDKYTDTGLKEDHQLCQVSGTKVGTHQHQPRGTLQLCSALD